MPADLVKDGASFFPNVLADPTFRKNGILFGDSAGGSLVKTSLLSNGLIQVDTSTILNGHVPWAVIDPRRHILSIWEKSGDDFPASGQKLGSSVFTNGSFNKQPLGTSKAQKAAAWTAVNVGGSIANWFLKGAGIPVNAKGILQKALYQSTSPEGWIVGNTRAILENTKADSRPTMYHFGRVTGRQFPDYAVGLGDPPLNSEWIGGLFPTLLNYAFSEPDQELTCGIWGLAPLSITDTALKTVKIDDSITAYDAYLDDIAPHSEGLMKDGQRIPCTGLLIVAFYSGWLTAFAAILSSARVKDAARIDGSDSIVMGNGAAINFDMESAKKKIYNRWGYMCMAG